MIKKYKIYFLGSDNLFSSNILNFLYYNDFKQFDFIGAGIKKIDCISRSNNKKNKFLKEKYINIKFHILNENNEEDLINILNDLQPKIIITASFGYILSKKILNLPFINFFINIHGSILPKYRGASPVTNCILNNDKNTGISFVEIDKNGIDTGRIYKTYNIDLDGTEKKLELEKKLAILAENNMEKTLYEILENKITPREQNKYISDYTNKIKKIDGLIDWDDNASLIERKYRAYYDWPKIYFYMYNKNNNNITKIIITELEVIDDIKDIFAINNTPKSILIEKNNMVVICGNYTGISIKKLIPENKNEMNISDFLSGLKIIDSKILEIK